MAVIPNQPVDLYGIAFALRYPEFIEHNPEADYDDNSFFGFSNHILWLPKDIYDRRQFDMGFVRKNGAGASGYGRIATLTLRADFIIIVDIVDRTSTRVIPFTIPVTGLQGIDPSGNPLALSVPVEMDTLWIELPEVSGLHEPTPARTGRNCAQPKYADGYFVHGQSGCTTY